MYKQFAVCLISLVCISASGVDSRVERWNLRIDRLKKIQAEADKGMLDRQLLHELTASGIKSSEEFLELLARYKGEDGSLKSDSRKYTVSEIENRVKAVCGPSVSLYYLSELFRASSDNAIKQKITGDINSFIIKKYGNSIKLSNDESDDIAMEYIFEKGITDFSSIFESIRSDILSNTEYELSRRDYNSNDTDIVKLILKHTEESVVNGKLSEKIAFDEKYLQSVPQWRFFEDRVLKNEEREKAVMDFFRTKFGKETAAINGADILKAEKEIFGKERDRIFTQLQNPISSGGVTGGNPLYEIPDIKKLGTAIDDIDRYRKNLINNVQGSEDPEYIKKLKSNNTGIALRAVSRLEAQYRSEEARIERLKKLRGNVIIYNEEVFRSSKNHFYNTAEEVNKYAALSADFIGALYTSGKTDPAKYTELHGYRCDRYLKYIAFAERLTADMSTLPEYSTPKIQSLYRGTVPRILHAVKIFLKPDPIPAGIRESMNRDRIRDIASINSDYRTGGTLLASSIRKNYDGTCAGILRLSSIKKASVLDSEGKIGQQEVDMLYAFAAKCSEAISSMKYTETALKKYTDEFNRISDGLKRNGTKGSSTVIEPLYSMIKDFNPEQVETETATREIIAKEGMEALSGSLSLIQYYRRKGVVIKIIPSDDDIKSMKRIFTESPEVSVSSWKMNGKNFRRIDANITAELKKIQEKNAWVKPPDSNNTVSLVIEKTGMNVIFNPPAGWKKIYPDQSDGIQKLMFESPDMRGHIELTAITSSDSNIQTLAGSWPEKSGFSMIKKVPGKKGDMDYMQSTAKNRYDQIMESYIIENKGQIIILSGKTTGELYRQLNRTLAELFKNLVITGS